MPREKKIGPIHIEILKKIKKQPMGTTELSISLDYNSSSGCSREVKYLEEKGMIKKIKKKWTIKESGLNYLKPFEECEKIISDEKREINPSIPNRIRKNLYREIHQFNDAPTNNAKDTAINQILTIVLSFSNKIIHWETEKELSEWINKFLEEPDKYDDIPKNNYNIKYLFFLILERLYLKNYFDKDNFKLLLKYYRPKTIDENDPQFGNINSTMLVIFLAMKFRPQFYNDGPFELFTILITKIRFAPREKISFLGYSSDIVQISDEIKDKLIDKLHEISRVIIDIPPGRDDWIIRDLLTTLNRNRNID